jgi:cytosine/adenosine deaminase-related metal-dependent hydrolase
MIRTIHRAKYVLAEPDLLLQDATVHVSDPGRISRVEPWQDPTATLEAEIVDWGSAVIMPGLVNAHTHLELTSLHGQLTRFSTFFDWVSQLIERRREWTREDYMASVRHGAQMCLSSGTTLVGDISASGVSWEALKPLPLRKVVFEEVLSFLPEAAAQTLASLETRLKRGRRDKLLRIGISPHAPYSVSPELYRALAQLAREKELPLATHLAETKEELEFLDTGAGPIEPFLQRLQALPERWTPPGLDPVSYLEQSGVLETPVLLIHCNYLDADSMKKILSSRSSVVYCPRSQSFFGHENHPVRTLLDLGVNVALGTDSLASNDSLSILDEMRFLFHSRQDLKAEEIFRMASVNGAAALGFGSTLGRLRRGFWADLTVLRLADDLGAKNYLSQILEGAGEWQGTVVRGMVASGLENSMHVSGPDTDAPGRPGSES